MACLKKRGNVYYAQYYLGPKQKRVSLETTSYQIVKEKLRSLESSLFRDEDSPLPTKTPIAVIVQKYVEHIRVIKTEKSAQTDIYYLRNIFGLACEGLKITSRKVTAGAKKRPAHGREVVSRKFRFFCSPLIER